LDDQNRLGWASAYLSQYAWVTVDMSQAEELGRRALAIGSATHDLPLRVAADYLLAQGYFTLGDYRRSLEHSRRNVALLVGDRVFLSSGFTGLPSVLSRMYLSWALTECGEFAEAIRVGTDAVQIAESSGRPYNLVLSCRAIAVPYLTRGSHADAIPYLERAFDLCKTWNLRFLIEGTMTALGSAYSLSGRLADSLPLLDQGSAMVSALWADALPTGLALSTTYLALERTSEAAELAARVMTLATERHARGFLAHALRLLGDINLRRNPLNESETEGHYRHSLAIAGELGMHPLIAHCHAGLGKLYRLLSDRERAEEHLILARSMYREMDMTFWLERT